MRIALILVLLVSSVPMAEAQGNPASDEILVTRIIEREHHVTRELEGFHPIVETHVQVMKFQRDELVPAYDRHFLSLAEFLGNLRALRFKPDGSEVLRGISESFDSFKPTTIEYNPDGFVAMAYPDPSTFDLRHYRFQYLDKEYVGDRLYLVFQVSPSATRKSGLFEGKIWVEYQDLTIVRFNGIYAGTNITRKYVHFDSRRVQAASGAWLPAVIYSGESELSCCAIGKLNWTKIRFKAETRFWGYDPRDGRPQDELAKFTIDSSNAVRDLSSSDNDRSPVDQQKMWERQAEVNVTDKLEHIGLLSPSGEVEKAVQGILKNIEVANHLSIEPEVRCRVLLTSNLESAVVGHTIILSRGLLDVLPSEATLAAVLAHDLAHVMLEHSMDTNFSWADQLRFDPTEVMRKVRLAHSAQEEARASSLGQEWMTNSPYKGSLESLAKFTAELRAQSPHIQQLLKAAIGESLNATLDAYYRGSSGSSLEQAADSAALLLGGRITIDPWTDQIAFVRAMEDDVRSVARHAPTPLTPLALNSQQPRIAAATPTALFKFSND
jgi:hypothetical protein